METFRSRLLKGNIKNADWEELFILIRHWKEDMEFYREDLQFLRGLIDRYSIWIKSRDNSKATHLLLTDLHQLTTESKGILEKMNQHLVNLSSLIQGSKSLNKEAILDDQENLENSIAEFIKGFRKNRQQVYLISERIMDSEDLSDHVKE